MITFFRKSLDSINECEPLEQTRWSTIKYDDVQSIFFLDDEFFNTIHLHKLIESEFGYSFLVVNEFYFRISHL